MTVGRRPPRIARAFVRALLPSKEREVIVGDLDELFARRLRRDGVREARAWYRRKAVASVLSRWTPAVVASRRGARRRARASGMVSRERNGGGPLAVGLDVMRGVRLSTRSLWRTPVFTLAALLTVGIGVGATAAVFGIADRVMFRPVAGVGAPEALALVWFANADNTRQRGTSYENVADLRQAVVGKGAIQGLAAQQVMSLHVTGGDGVPVAVMGAAVLGDYFDVLRVPFVRGRPFTAAESDVGAAAVAVISEALWRARFGAVPDVVGRKLIVNRVPLTVVGVAAGGFRGTARYANEDVWVPGGLYGTLRHFDDPSLLRERGRSVWRELIVRMAPRATASAAESQLRGAMERLVEAYPDENAPHVEQPPTVFPGIGLDVMVRERTATTVRLMLAVVAFVLLIACSNVASLLLVRGAKRRGELAVRRALGASGRRLVGQQLVEAALIGAGGGFVGAGFAAAVGRLFGTASLVGVRAGVDVAVDGRVFVFALAVSLAATALFGTVPGWIAVRVDPIDGLRAAGVRDTGRNTRLRAGLTTLQLALSLVLLVGALLLTRTLANLQRVELGIEPDRIVTLLADLDPQGYDRAEAQIVLQRLMARLASIPEFEAVATSQRTPFFGYPLGSRVVDPRGDGEAAVGTDIDFVSEGYFETVGLRVLHGRGLRASDRGAARGGPHNAVLTAALARRLFGDEAAAIGRRLRTAVRSPEELHVVGVVADARTVQVVGEPDEIVYQMIDTAPLSISVFVLARTDVPTQRAAALFRESLGAVASGLPASRVERVSDTLAAELSEQRLLARLLGLFAVIALTLTAVGLYGIIASAVAERTREIGVRLALGAQNTGIVTLMLRRAAVVIVPGLALGLGGAVAAVRVLESRLFGVTPLDPITYVAAAALLAVIALVAVLIPTRAATRVDPVRALRSD